MDSARGVGVDSVPPPLLGLASDQAYGIVKDLWPAQATDARVVHVPDSGHFIVDEQPDFVARQLIEFLA